MDKHVLLPHARSRVKIVGDLAVKGLFHIRASPRHPEHLDENDARRVIDTKIAFGWVDQMLGGVTGDDLEFVVLRHFGNFDHRGVNDLADDLGQFRCRGIADVYSCQRHGGPFNGIGWVEGAPALRELKPVPPSGLASTESRKPPLFHLRAAPASFAALSPKAGAPFQTPPCPWRSS